MDNNYNKFRRATFGGFNREDVINYIEKMKNEFFDYKKEVEQTVTQLNAKIRELEAVCDTMEEKEAYAAEFENEPTEVNPVDDINEATHQLRMVADELCKSLCDFMDKVSENAVSVVIEKQTETVTEELVIDTEDEEDAVTDESAEKVTEETDEIIDKVSSILRTTASFCVSDNEKESEEKVAEPATEKRNILDILGGASFLK